MSYLARRVAGAVLQLGALSLTAFLLTEIVPGDVFSDTRLDPRTSAASVEAWRRELHLEDPWWKRFATWSSHAVRAGFGNSLASGMPVPSLIAPRLGRTLQVVIPAWLLSWLAGLALAAATVRWSLWRYFEGGAAILQLVPEAITASLFTWVSIVHWHVDPLNPVLSLLPVALALTPTVFLHSAAALSAAREARFVKIAALSGVDPATIWTRYLAPAIANPLIGLVGPSFASAFGSALVVEVITGWPGIGALFTDAFRSRDYPVTQAVLVLLGTILILFTLIADLVLFRMDPRIRAEGDA